MKWKKEKEVKPVEPIPVTNTESVNIGKTSTVEEPKQEVNLVEICANMTDSEFKAQILSLLLEIREAQNGR